MGRPICSAFSEGSTICCLLAANRSSPGSRPGTFSGPARLAGRVGVGSPSRGLRRRLGALVKQDPPPYPSQAVGGFPLLFLVGFFFVFFCFQFLTALSGFQLFCFVFLFFCLGPLFPFSFSFTFFFLFSYFLFSPLLVRIIQKIHHILQKCASY